ncbi:toxin-antitoxin system YwqK family antitoxin [Sphingobacterium cavernae]|uniref:toxin-antitoxin system YwqK family antitoxin n=1 Tax=Sphingobacterium cavernae TaxID=2592657 RepID=UPI00122FEFE0|nr:hypothetical protein [Sphingobacterium cavernae]
MKYSFIALFFYLMLAKSNAQTNLDYYQNLLGNKTITLHDDSTNVKYVFDVKKKKVTNTATNSTYYWYTAGKIVQNQGGYDGKILHGDFSAFYPNKKMAERGEFKNGLKTGHWRKWRNDGTLQERTSWKKGIQTGKYVIFNELGNEIERGNKKNGYKHGKIIVYTSNSAAPTFQYFNKGKEITKEDYIQQNLFRRSGNYIQEQWKKLFKKKEGHTMEDSNPQPSI